MLHLIQDLCNTYARFKYLKAVSKVFGEETAICTTVYTKPPRMCNYEQKL